MPLPPRDERSLPSETAGSAPVPAHLVSRRTMLGGGLLGAGLAACASHRASVDGLDDLKRCEQMEGERRLEMPLELLWTRELPAPLLAKLDTMHSGDLPGGGVVGDCEQWVAPEWFWAKPTWGKREPKPHIGTGELEYSDPNRAHTVYRDVDQPNSAARLEMIDTVVEIVPGYLTKILGYGNSAKDAGSPGPTFQVRLGQPLLVRAHNDIDRTLHLETSVHLHGGHTPAHSDGHPNFMIKPGESRDYYYPNPVPLRVKGKLVEGVDDEGVTVRSVEWEPIHGDWDMTEVPSTMWYHDHAEDITAHNALMGLAGFYILKDAHEIELIESGVLPASDTAIALRDVCLCAVEERQTMDADVCRAIDEANDAGTLDPTPRAEARIHFDPFDHDGALGNLILCNGIPYPNLKLGRGRHRLRFLNASLARFYHLRFVAVRKRDRRLAVGSDGRPLFLPILRIGKDSWLLPKALRTASTFLGMANRADVVLDVGMDLEQPDGIWSAADYDLFLVSTLDQRDGRGPGHGDNEFEPDDPRGDPRDPPDIELPGSEFRMPDDPRSLDVDDHGRPRNWRWILRIQFDSTQAVSEASVGEGTALREHESLIESLQHIEGVSDVQSLWDAIPRREFDFERRQGAWQINHRFYDAELANAVPALWSTELWVLRNRSGGWWHPIHIHLESHQHVYAEARYGDTKIAIRDPLYTREVSEESSDDTQFDPTVWNLGIKHDTTVLGPNTEVHVLMRFRTFQGPFVFHCHNLNHEDMRMMFQFDPRLRAGGDSVDDAPPTSDANVRMDYWFYTDLPHGGGH